MPESSSQGGNPARIADMTYGEYHLVFNLPVLCLLLWLNRGRMDRRKWAWLAAVAAIAFVFTTPWDNWAVYKGMWSFQWDEVIPITIPFRGVEWKLPLEEYAFFLLMTLNVGLLANLFLPRQPVAR